MCLAHPLDGHTEGLLLGKDVGNGVGLFVGGLLGVVDGLKLIEGVEKKDIKIKYENRICYKIHNFTKEMDPTICKHIHVSYLDVGVAVGEVVGASLGAVDGLAEGELLGMGDICIVGRAVGRTEGDIVGRSVVGRAEGDIVGRSEGVSVGVHDGPRLRLGSELGWDVGDTLSVGPSDGDADGLVVGEWLGAVDGLAEGELLGMGDFVGRSEGASEGDIV